MNLIIGNTYRMYAKDGDKRFAPMDYKRGCTVGNLIYATLFTVDDEAKRDLMNEVLAELTEDNPTWKFEYRKA